MLKKILIVGDGISAITAIKAIREVNKECDVCVVGEEKAYPYNRIRLSKGIFGDLSEDSILLQKKGWYEENNIDLLVNKKVVNIDTENKSVLLCNGKKLNYDKLLLANGARNNIPRIDGIGLEGVYTIRNLEQALEIKSKLSNCSKVISIGGGIQGLEIAWILHQYGKKVQVVEIQSRLMYNLLDEEAGKMLKSIVEAQGIEVLVNTTVREIIKEKNLIIITDDKTKLSCDMAIYSAGIKPNIELIENTDIKAARGILVNSNMETNLRDVYAAGDVAEFNNHISGLWNIAIAQGKVAGYNICGKEAVYESIIPVTTLNAFEISLFSMGCVEETKADRVMIYKDVESKQYKKIFIRKDKIVGAIVMGDTKKSPILKAAIEEKISLETIDLDNISIEGLLDKLKNSRL